MKKNYDVMLSRFHLIPERHGQTDRQTELLYRYRASVCWRAIKKNYRGDEFTNTPRHRQDYGARGRWKSPFHTDLSYRPYNSVSTNVLHCDVGKVEKMILDPYPDPDQSQSLIECSLLQRLPFQKTSRTFICRGFELSLCLRSTWTNPRVAQIPLQLHLRKLCDYI